MLSPKNVLITGANKGLGLELVKQFLKYQNHQVCWWQLAEIQPKQRSDLNEVANLHTNLTILKLDVTSTADIEETVNNTSKYFSEKGLNLLINNAGVAYKKQYIGNINKRALTEQFDVNLFGPLLLSQAMLPYLKQAAKSSSVTGLSCNRAAIVNMSSNLGSIAMNNSGGLYPYRTSKAALNMMTKNMNIDLKPVGILCCCLHPGWVRTDLGGPTAILDKETSVLGLMNVMSKINENSDIFIDYSGKPVTW